MLPNFILKERTEITKVKFHLIQNSIHRVLETLFWTSLRSYGHTNPVIFKVCSVDHQWSTRSAQVVSELQYKHIFHTPQSTSKFLVLSAEDKFGNY